MSERGVLTTAGLNALLTDGYAQFDYLAVGTGTQTPAVGLTALVTELDRVAVGAYEVSGGVLTIEAALYNNDGVGTVTEFGLYTASSGGTLLAYGLFAASFTKTSNEMRVISVALPVTNT